MDKAEIAALYARIEALEQDKASLLDELEGTYLHLEEQLTTFERERDIAYQELRERNHELEVRLEELEKAHLKLQEAQQMLIRSERLAAMGEMAAAIVHEIRNPLTVIIARVQLMRMQPDLAERNLKILEESSEYLRSLTENVLRFSRNQRGEASHVNMNHLLVDVEEFVKPIVRDIVIELEVAEDLPQVLVDGRQIEQVLVNLIMNAGDAMEGISGTVWLNAGRATIQSAIEQADARGQAHTLAVEMDAEALGRDYVFAEVRDNGPGISESHMSQLFEAFFTTKEEGKGTGLGLSIARTIVGEWDGNVLLTSSEGEGACFRVFLPVTSV
ncbi:MAG: ATP-binding protein [bacterium]|nr:ATP-binding protein [bacterium]